MLIESCHNHINNRGLLLFYFYSLVYSIIIHNFVYTANKIDKKMKVGLFIPCYINAVYPEVGVASYKLLKSLGVDVDYPLDQTCCGQPMANAGFENESKELAKRFDRLFESYDYIVGPSASCVVFVRDHYGNLLEGEKHRCASEGKIYDICEFIHDVVKPSSLKASFPHKVSIQNSCHGVRLMKLSSPSELNIPYYNKLRAWGTSDETFFSKRIEHTLL